MPSRLRMTLWKSWARHDSRHPQSRSRRTERLLARPFWRLVAHFGMRLFSGTGDSGEGGLGLSVEAVLGFWLRPEALPPLFCSTNTLLS